MELLIGVAAGAAAFLLGYRAGSNAMARTVARLVLAGLLHWAPDAERAGHGRAGRCRVDLEVVRREFLDGGAHGRSVARANTRVLAHDHFR